MINQNSLKIKAMSLAAEARIIRKMAYKMKKRKLELAYDSLYRHNKDIVATEARATHIARTFLKNKPFSSAEGKLHPIYVGNTYIRTGWRYNNQQRAIKRARQIAEKYWAKGGPELSTWDIWLTT